MMMMMMMMMMPLNTVKTPGFWPVNKFHLLEITEGNH